MIRLVLDTNVLVSAILVPEGPPAQLLSLVRNGAVELVFSPPTLVEVLEVLRRPRLVAFLKKHDVGPEEAEDFIRALAGISVLASGELKAEGISADANDNMFLACAVEGEAQYIVSGDRHLTDLKNFQGIPIMRPAEFLQLVRKDEPTI
jgi:putative PIN family toxin of toxin-antitoxin system